MIYVVITVLLVAADLATKQLVLKFLTPIGDLPVIDGIFHLTYVENTGVAFGMFKDMRFMFIIISLIVLIVLAVYFIKSKKRTVWLQLGTAMIYGGAIGNLVERIFRGFVVDFLNFEIIGFPVFNVADICVCAGAVMVLVHCLFLSSDETDKVQKR